MIWLDAVILFHFLDAFSGDGSYHYWKSSGFEMDRPTCTTRTTITLP